MSEFIRLTSADGPVVVACDAILTVRPVPGGSRVTLRDSLTILDVTDAPDAVADLLAPEPSEEFVGDGELNVKAGSKAAKTESDPKATTK